MSGIFLIKRNEIFKTREALNFIIKPLEIRDYVQTKMFIKKLMC